MCCWMMLNEGRDFGLDGRADDQSFRSTAVVIAGTTGRACSCGFLPWVGGEHLHSSNARFLFFFYPLRARTACTPPWRPPSRPARPRPGAPPRACLGKERQRERRGRTRQKADAFARPSPPPLAKQIRLSLPARALTPHTHSLTAPHRSALPVLPSQRTGVVVAAKVRKVGEGVGGGLALTALACARSSTPRPSLLSHPTDHRRRAPLQVRLRQLGKRTGEGERDGKSARERLTPRPSLSPFSIPI